MFVKPGSHSPLDYQQCSRRQCPSFIADGFFHNENVVLPVYHKDLSTPAKLNSIQRRRDIAG